MACGDFYNYLLNVTPKIFGGLKDLVILGTAITGAVVAVKGLGTWKRQINGQSNYTLSKNLLVSLFKYRDAIEMVRNPFMSSQEMPLPPLDERNEMNSDAIRFYGLFKAYEKRWEKVAGLHSEIYASLIEAEALWGDELSAMWKDLRKKENELLIQLQNYIQICNPRTPTHEKERLQASQEKMHNTLYEGGKSDLFKSQFETDLSKMTGYIKEKIKG